MDATGPALDWGMRRITKALKRHDERCSHYAALERVYEATKGEEKLRPELKRIRFAYQRTDVLMAYLTNDKPVTRVAPLHPGADCERAAKSMQRAMNIWRRRDHADEKEIELALTACVFGNAPYKSIWDYDRRLQKRREVKKAFMGLGTPRFEEVEDYVTLRDEPSLIPWNPYDYAWDPRATSEDTMRYAIFFDYPTKSELLAMQQKGLVFNIDELQPATSREAQRFQRPGKERDLDGCIEVAEIWDVEENRQVSIANRNTVICDQPSPYWHGEIPGGVCSTQPNLYAVDGTSEVEIIAAIQAEMHSFRENWILDAKLATKLIAFIDSSISGTELDKINNSLMVDDGKPVQVIPIDPGGAPPTIWSPAGALVGLGEQIVGALKVDMDDMSGVNQYISGQSDSDVDPKTATEVTQLATASQRRINAKKNQLGRGYQRHNVFALKNTKQFMNTPLIVRLDGVVPDAAISQGANGSDYSFDAVDPQDVADAELEILISNADESIDKQEKRQQWLLLANTVASMVAVCPPTGPVPNMPRFIEELLEAYDVEDPDDFFVQPPVLPDLASLMPPDGEPPLGAGGGGVATPLGPVPPPLAGGPGRAGPPNPGAAA
jgi:hypothetical protein